MAARAPMLWRPVAVIATLIAVIAGPALGQILPWEVTVAEVEAGRLRGLVERLAKQNLLYQLRLGDVRKQGLIETAEQIDRVLVTLERGSPSYSVPAPWTRAISDQISEVDRTWGPLRRIATASAYDSFRVSQMVAPRDARQGDPLLLGYFDQLAEKMVRESEVLLEIYHRECLKTGMQICPTAVTSGYASMLIERAAKQAVLIVAELDVPENRQRLNETIQSYRELRKANQQNAFFAAALDPKRGLSAQAAAGLLKSLRTDWDDMQRQFRMLAAGDAENFDVPQMLRIQSRLVDKVERMGAALVRYASLAYGS